MTTDAEIIATRVQPAGRSTPDHAPSPWLLVFAVLTASIATAWLSTILTPAFLSRYHQSNPLYGRLILMGVVFALPTIMAVLLTRRSAMPITVATATLMAVLQPRGLAFGPAPLIGAALMGIGVWLACTRRPVSITERRAPGERMPRSVWIPLLALCLMPIPYVLRAMISNREVPVGMASMMIIMPIVNSVILGWIVAMACDRFGTAVARDAIAKNTPTV